ncbi:unnamed protein product [Psylliodes chrysocephalus]|uniref:Uncharacterized protein n=1 Tax=Psylliodes chrysocephalus TaxID=3402493 RepID=A0A9P0D9J6_9CUCU|nr:unnamed protein product [Psylliodes chrysocephala]
MKYEAKTYKSKLKVDVMGTGGGPSTLKENSILEEVLVLIGRAGVEIENIPGSDFQPAVVVDIAEFQVQVESGETSATFQVPLVQLASTSRQITPSRRRPIVKASIKEQLSKEKEIRRKGALSVSKRKAEQSIHLPSIILQKLENNEDVDPSLIHAIFKD